MRSLRTVVVASAGLLIASLALAGDPAKDAAGDPLPEGARARLGTTRFLCTYQIGQIAWAPDGKSIAVGAGNDLKVFDRQSGAALHALAVDTPVGWAISAIAWTPDGKALVFSTQLENLCVWTLGTKTPRLIENVAGKDLKAIAVSPDGKTVAAAGEEKVVRLIDLAAGTERLKLEGHEGAIRSLAFSKDGKVLASAGEDKVVHLWSTDKGAEISKIGTPDEVDEVAVVAFLPDGKSIVTAGNQTVRIFDVASGKLTAPLFDFDGNTRTLAVSPDGKTIASNAGRSVTLWSSTGPFTEEPPTAPRKKFTAADGTLDAVAFSPDGKTVAAVGGPILRLFDATSGAEAARPEGHRDAVNGLAYSPDGKTLASTSSDRNLALWDPSTGKARWLPQAEQLGGVAWSPDGKVLAVGCRSSFDPKVLIIEAASGKVVAELEGHKYSIDHLAFSPDGKTLATATGDKIARLWDVASKKEVGKVELPESPASIAFAPDGKHFAVGASKELVLLYSTGTSPALVKKLSEADSALSTNALAFSRDGKVLAACAGKPRLIEVESGKVIATGEVDVFTDGIALAPDGKTFAAGCNGSQASFVFLFDAASGKQLKKLTGQTGGVRRLAFSPDGKTLAAAGQEGPIVLWNH